MDLTLSPGKVFRTLTMIVIGLALAQLFAQVAFFWLGADFIQRFRLMGGVHQLDLDEENNLGYWYQTTALLLCSALLAVIARAGGWIPTPSTGP